MDTGKNSDNPRFDRGVPDDAWFYNLQHRRDCRTQRKSYKTSQMWIGNPAPSQLITPFAEENGIGRKRSG
jgi:hypothetical protein